LSLTSRKPFPTRSSLICAHHRFFFTTNGEKKLNEDKA